MSILVSSQFVAESPFAGTWESPMTGFVSTSSALTGSQGTVSSHAIGTFTIQALGLTTLEATPYFILVMDTATPQTGFTNLQVIASGVGGLFTNTYSALGATFYPVGSLIGPSTTLSVYPTWLWTDFNNDFSPSASAITTINPISAALTTPSAPGGNGDITDPEAWQGANGAIPPLAFSQVPYNVNYPLDGDGRYWFQANANAPNIGNQITFIGNPSYFVDTANLECSVVATANDGSGLIVAYSVTTGTWTTTTLLPQTQLGGLQNTSVIVNLSGATQFQLQVYAQGGTALTTATLSQVAIAITRNANESMTWDGFQNPFDPINYNALVADNVVPTATMTSLQYRMMVRLGFSNQAANPPPGMAALTQDFLTAAQTYLYKRYLQLHTKRFFRWKINPGQRFYSLRDNDENVLESVNIDPMKCVEWVGIQDSRNVWYPMIQGIPPQLYTMITKPWRPARYEIRNAIEIYPVPDQTYWLWVRGHFGLMSFINGSDVTTIDAELVFLHALANAKAHYGQPDANNIEAQANAYRAELIAATHQTAHYVPGTIAVPPAVRPTLIQFDANSGGGS